MLRKGHADNMDATGWQTSRSTEPHNTTVAPRPEFHTTHATDIHPTQPRTCLMRWTWVRLRCSAASLDSTANTMSARDHVACGGGVAVGSPPCVRGYMDTVPVDACCDAVQFYEGLVHAWYICSYRGQPDALVRQSCWWVTQKKPPARHAGPVGVHARPPATPLCGPLGWGTPP